MKQHIWDKAEMTNTGVDASGKTYKNKSQLYAKRRNGKIKHLKKGNNLSNRIPGGGFYSTLLLVCGKKRLELLLRLFQFLRKMNKFKIYTLFQ